MFTGRGNLKGATSFVKDNVSNVPAPKKDRLYPRFKAHPIADYAIVCPAQRHLP